MRLYAPDKAALWALGGTNIKLLLDVPNPALEHIAASQGNADQWVQDNIKKYSNVNLHDSFVRFLFSAMQNIHTIIIGAGIGNHIKVSTATFFAALKVSYPSSHVDFHPKYQQLLVLS